MSNPADLTAPHSDIPAFLVIHVFSLSKPWIMLVEVVGKASRSFHPRLNSHGFRHPRSAIPLCAECNSLQLSGCGSIQPIGGTIG